MICFSRWHYISVRLYEYFYSFFYVCAVDNSVDGILLAISRSSTKSNRGECLRWDDLYDVIRPSDRLHILPAAAADATSRRIQYLATTQTE